MKGAAKLIINGTVQGVFFRQFCKDEADKLNLRGYIRNLESGEIEILVEGEKEKIEELYQKLKKGPPHAQIREIKVEERKWSGDQKEFKILKF